MEGEIYRFRSRFMGGFNRDDVVRYIAQIAGERNDCIMARDIAEAEAERLRAEVDRLNAELVQHKEIIHSYERLIEKLRTMKDNKQHAADTHIDTPPLYERQNERLYEEKNNTLCKTPEQKHVIIIKRKKTKKWS